MLSCHIQGFREVISFESSYCYVFHFLFRNTDIYVVLCLIYSHLMFIQGLLYPSCFLFPNLILPAVRIMGFLKDQVTMQFAIKQPSEMQFQATSCVKLIL